MKNLDMIETQGGGIRKVFNFQRQRYFPMPDYDLSDQKVKVTITGKILDEDFARILIKNPSLSLEDIILLDKVQKKKIISEEEFRYLKKLNFIEGRRGNCFLSFKVIASTNDEDLKVQYIRNRSFDDKHFRNMIIEYLERFGETKRNALDKLIIPKLSDALTERQKKKKVSNLMKTLRENGKVRSVGYGSWELLKED
jgi:ATP-dependent DNA helicase RecG